MTPPVPVLLDDARALSHRLRRRALADDATLVDRLAVALEREHRLRTAPPKCAALTRVQSDVLRFLRMHYAAHGYMPTMVEISRAIGRRSPATAHEHVRALEEKGYVCRVPHGRRGLMLVEGGANG